MFEQQSKSVAEKLAELVESDLEDSDAGVIAGLLFEPDEWTEQLFQAMVPGLLLAVRLGRDREAEQWHTSHPDAAARAKPAADAIFDVDGDTDGFVQELSAAEYWSGIQKTTEGDVRETVENVLGMDSDSDEFVESFIEAAVALGLATAAGAAASIAAGSVGKIEMMDTRLKYLFRRYHAKDESIDDDDRLPRAGFIAENEAANALNFGHNQAMRKLLLDGENVSKQWVDRDDGRVRPSHVAVGGTVVGVFDYFLVGNEFAPYPRWHGLSMEERAGCRCRLRAVDGAAEAVMAELAE